MTNKKRKEWLERKLKSEGGEIVKKE